MAAPSALRIRDSVSVAFASSGSGPLSLRELDLNKRLLRYPLSYLVYSEQFDALQPSAKAQFFRRVRAILTGTDSNKDFSHLSDADRKAILEILTDTKPDFAASAVEEHR